MTQQDFKCGISGIDPSSGEAYGGGIWDAINTGIKSASGILSARYAVPQLNAGQYISTPQGTMYQLGAGQTNALFPGASSFSSGGMGPILMIGGALLVLMMVVKK